MAEKKIRRTLTAGGNVILGSASGAGQMDSLNISLSEIRDRDNRSLNKRLLTGWIVFIVILFVSYILELADYFRGSGGLSPVYVGCFAVVVLIPFLLTLYFYRNNPGDIKVLYTTVAGHTCMYLYIMMFGNSPLLFAYIIPIMVLLVLYHNPKFLLMASGAAMVINILNVCRRVMFSDNVNPEEIQNIKIQLVIMAMVSGACYLASVIFRDSHRRKEEYSCMLEADREQIEQMTMQTIETIANAVDAKDEYTEGHSRRVSEYSCQIAQRMGFDEESLLYIRYIAILHDVGKISVPDAVLNKPSGLTDAEYMLMKHHTTAGAEILKDIVMIPGIESGARYHHERYDGKGYPNGLKGEEIPLVARIIALADAYDAMTSNRVYRKHLTLSIVMDEIKRAAGTQFDPEVVEAFLEYLNETETDHTQPGEATSDGNEMLQKFMAEQEHRVREHRELDELTGLLNRTFGERHISDMMEKADGALILINVDNTREINRNYGFRRGDYYLKSIAAVVSSPGDGMLVSRFGGDEFLIFLPEKTEKAAVSEFMDDLIKRVADIPDPLGGSNRITFSAGITIHDGKERDIARHLAELDNSLYHAKQSNKGSYCFFDTSSEAQEDFSGRDLGDLIEAIRRTDNYSEDEIMGNRDFYRMYTFVNDVAGVSNVKLRLIMFTAVVKDAVAMKVEQRDKVMNILEDAIIREIKDEQLMSSYSSIQRIVTIMGDIPQEDVEDIINRIMTSFYKFYEGKNVEVTWEIGEMS